MVTFLLEHKHLLETYPLRYVSRNSSYTTIELYEVLKYLWDAKQIDTYTITLTRAEMGLNMEQVKNSIDDMRAIAKYINIKKKHRSHEELNAEILKADYNESLFNIASEYRIEYWLIEVFSERFAYEAFKYVLDTMEDPWTVGAFDQQGFYLLDLRIRTLSRHDYG